MTIMISNKSINLQLNFNKVADAFHIYIPFIILRDK